MVRTKHVATAIFALALGGCSFTQDALFPALGGGGDDEETVARSGEQISIEPSAAERGTQPTVEPAPQLGQGNFELLNPLSTAPVSRLHVPAPTPPDRLPRPPVPEKLAVAVPATSEAIAPRAVTSPASRADLPTQVPPPPRLPEVPAVSPAREVAPPVVEAPTVEAVRAPVAPQVAALPGAPDEYDLRLEFEPGSARLPDDGRQPLQELAGQLDDDADTRLQLRAYADGTTETSSLARRLSLSRALAVRSYLIEQGVRTTRMDVRALGNKSSDGPPDRVDIVLVDQ